MPDLQRCLPYGSDVTEGSTSPAWRSDIATRTRRSPLNGSRPCAARKLSTIRTSDRCHGKVDARLLIQSADQGDHFVFDRLAIAVQGVAWDPVQTAVGNQNLDHLRRQDRGMEQMSVVEPRYLTGPRVRGDRLPA